MSGTVASGSNGTMIVVVGPSGVGKDAIIDFARQRLEGHAGISFVRRVITRLAAAGGEDHIPASPDEFSRRQANGDFAVSWHAHGLSYGIPSDVLGQIDSGITLVANGSRAAIPDIAKAFPRTVMFSITADPDIIAARLKGRGRESADEIRGRLSRTADAGNVDCRRVVIDNSGTLDIAGMAFVDKVLEIAGIVDLKGPARP